jgi:hypothetical protein
VLLPVGQEAEFKVKKDKLYLRVPDGDRKMRPYQVVGMEQPSSGGGTESTSYKPAARTPDSRASDKAQAIDKQPSANDTARTTPPRQ